MTRKLEDDCFRPGSERLKHAEAIAHLQAVARPVAGIERVPLHEASGRILAESVVARHPVPLHTNAAVDGYAFAYASYDRSAGAALDLAGRAAAGHPVTAAVGPGSAVRIFTGAAMPPGTDTVAMQEDVEVSSATAGRPAIVRIPGGLKAGANVRKAGEDVAAATIVCAAGQRLRPQDVAALASVGRAEVEVGKRLRVALIASGDEVVRPGEMPLRPGQVFDANTAMLFALLRLTGAEATDFGILADRAGDVRVALRQAALHHDVVLSSGGASGGEEDHFGAALAALGTRHFWQLAVKPGRPMMLGQIDGVPVIGLPGNPVAVFVCFLMYVHPLLCRLGGAPWPTPRRFPFPAAFEFKGRKPGRREFWRGRLVRTPDGWQVEKFRRDGSGLITGLREAEGLIDIPEDAGDVAPGDLVSFIPFSEYGF